VIEKARYVHTNLVARDWELLVAFYERVFGCVRVPPERHYSGPQLEAGTAIPGAQLDGVHLLLPGYGEGGPTLEIFAYAPSGLDPRPRVNDRGYGHVAFQVASVTAAREEVLSAGGSAVGDVVTLNTADRRRVTWCYVRDPEGNILELQSWSQE